MNEIIAGCELYFNINNLFFVLTPHSYFTGDECKKRWKTIQETYILKQRPLAGSAAPKKRIQMSSDLSFLDDDYEGI